MSKEKFDFSNAEYTHFLEVCPFSDEEKAVLDLRRRGKSDVEIGIALNISSATVSRRIKSVCRKIMKEL